MLVFEASASTLSEAATPATSNANLCWDVSSAVPDIGDVRSSCSTDAFTRPTGGTFLSESSSQCMHLGARVQEPCAGEEGVGTSAQEAFAHVPAQAAVLLGTAAPTSDGSAPYVHFDKKALDHSRGRRSMMLEGAPEHDAKLQQDTNHTASITTRLQVTPPPQIVHPEPKTT